MLRTDMATRAAYSSDASLFRRVPAAILEPETVEDIRRGVRIARKRGWPIVGRGGGTSVAGNAIGEGLIIDTSRRFNRIIAIDAGLAVVEPGVICDDLRAAAAEFGLTFGPDPSTHSRCTIGGMVANNACGSHSVAWGTAADNLVAVTLLLADGREVTLDEHGCSDPTIDARLRSLFDAHRDLVTAELGRFPRQVSGFGLHRLGSNMAAAVAGSEGTLGVITRLTVRLVPRPTHTALVVLTYPDIFAAAAAAPGLRLPGVTTIEGMGGDLLGKPEGGWLYCEVVGDSDEEVAARAAAVREHAPAGEIVTDPARARALWRVREAAAGLATRLPDGSEAWPNWEDSAVPPENLEGYLRDLYALLARFGYRGIPFGHFGEGCVHVRISFDFTTDAGVARFREFMVAAARLVVSHGGSLSGEHGDGRARSALLGEMYSPQMLELFAQFKAIFDPDGVFNPGVLVAADDVTDGLRMEPAQRGIQLREAHAFHRDPGGFLGGINRCVGVGACRSSSGAMCPSFQLTGDELDSTRGRARVLSEMFRGETVADADVGDALDLCLSCKACAAECPVGVDMATYKAEFTFQRYRRRLRPRHHYTLGWLPLTARLPGVLRLLSVRPLAPVIRALGGLGNRPLIGFSGRRLRVPWQALDNPRGRVVLWPDTFSALLDPAPAEAAAWVLRWLGFEVIVPTAFVCCGLTWHSTGQLGMARRVVEHSARVLGPYLDEGLPVIAVEPSCAAALRHEATELSAHPQVARLAEATVSFATFVAPLLAELDWPATSTTALTQVHCHERAQGDPAASAAVLEAMGIAHEEIATGCCGLAGNWGFEPGHEVASFALGERELFPRVRAATGEVIADGFSCRTQIEQGTGRRARHLAELVRDAVH